MYSLGMLRLLASAGYLSHTLVFENMIRWRVESIFVDKRAKTLWMITYGVCASLCVSCELDCFLVGCVSSFLRKGC